jgi:hypothetical protein
MTVDSFAGEARVERTLPLLRAGNIQAHTVGVLVGMVLAEFERLLERLPDGRIQMGRLANVRRAVQSRGLPSAADLQTLLHQEYAATRSVLQARAISRRTIPMSVEQLPLNVGLCDMTAGVVNLNATRTEPAKSTDSDPKGPKQVHVSRWSDLAIGLNCSNPLVFTPAPMTGTYVRISDGIPINLPGKRWVAVLDLASRSIDGRTISRRELLQRLGKQSPSRTRNETPATQAAADGLHSTGTTPERFLSTFFSELRGHLHDQIDCPEDRKSLFQVSGDDIQLGFVIRGLLGDITRHYTFGSPT